MLDPTLTGTGRLARFVDSRGYAIAIAVAAYATVFAEPLLALYALATHGAIGTTLREVLFGIHAAGCLVFTLDFLLHLRLVGASYLQQSSAWINLLVVVDFLVSLASRLLPIDPAVLRVLRTTGALARLGLVQKAGRLESSLVSWEAFRFNEDDLKYTIVLMIAFAALTWKSAWREYLTVWDPLVEICVYAAVMLAVAYKVRRNRERLQRAIVNPVLRLTQQNRAKLVALLGQPRVSRMDDATLADFAAKGKNEIDLLFEQVDLIFENVRKFVSDRALREARGEVVIPQGQAIAMSFTDIEGFTNATQAMQALVIPALARYLQTMSGRIISGGGDIEKFIGDAIFYYHYDRAAPGESCNRAFDTALACMQEVRAMCLTDAWKACFASGSWDRFHAFRTRYGMHYGPVTAGPIGSLDEQARVESTLIGDNVNLTARLEALAKHYGLYLLLSEDFRAQLSPERQRQCRLVDFITVKGREDAPFRIYTVDEAPPAPAFLADYERGLQAYFAGDWTAAHALLEQAREQVPDDGPTRALLDRIEALKLFSHRAIDNISRRFAAGDDSFENLRTRLEAAVVAQPYHPPRGFVERKGYWRWEEK
jgi:class 3 adenylate cyclase